MNKNNLFSASVILLLVAIALPAQAQDAAAPTSAPAAKKTPSKGKGGTKTIKIDYENETVMGTYDVPDAQFINSRKMIKYKELFNKRTNFIEEIEANKGLFNEYQK